MKNAVIAAQKSTWRSKLDLSYLNEVSDLKRKQQKRLGNHPGRDLKQFTSYASKEFTGSVHAAGFLHDMIAVSGDGHGVSPVNLPNDEREARIVKAWTQILGGPCLGKGAKKDVIQHRMVFSMSSPMYNACLKARLNPDRVLHLMMIQTMRRFRERFHHGDRIGYAYGFHHDTEHLHVHVALCPRTVKGFYVGYSKPKFKENRSGHRNQFEFVQQCFKRQNEVWGDLLTNPLKVKQLQKKQRAHKLFLTPHLKTLMRSRDLRHSAEIIKLQAQRDYLVSLKSYLDSVESASLQKRCSRLVRVPGRHLPIIFPLQRLVSHWSGRSVRERNKKLRSHYFRKRQEYLVDLRKFKLTTGSYAVVPTLQTTKRISQRESNSAKWQPRL